jgi:drug/metabolite transporter (DMT)-like permease
VAGFSGTSPATRAVVLACGPAAAVVGRVAIGAGAAALILFLRRERPPSGRGWRRLTIIAASIVIGFPTLSALASRALPSAHVALVFGLLPLATSLVAWLRGGERPSPAFWFAALAGFAAVAAFGLARGGGGLRAADALALSAVAAAAVGYNEGALLAREMGGWRVICWALVAGAPALLAAASAAGWRIAPAVACVLARPAAALGAAYLGVVSMLLAFFAWYRGLALGGIAKGGQLQLAQLPLSLVWSALLLGEPIGAPELATAAALVVSLLFVARTTVARPIANPEGRS